MVIYGTTRKKLAILTIREHLCGFFELKSVCVNAGTVVDPQTGHTLCLGCSRITFESGLRECDQCDREYINKEQHQDNNFETICPDCVVRYGYV
jgi:hypothetical protein